MRVQLALNMKLVESNVFEFSQPLAPTPREDAKTEATAPDTPVLPMGSSTVAPGLSVAVC
jgi:hypothetical protein